MNIEYLSNKSIMQKLFDILRIHHVLRNQKTEYPRFSVRYCSKMIPGLFDGTREIIFLRTTGNQIAAVTILKKEETEKKICTFKVLESYQRKGYGTLLLKLACNWLHTNRPMITVPESRISEFEAFFENNGYFTLKSEYKDYYKNGSTEYSYNGELQKI